MKKNDILNGICVDYTHDGLGIVKSNDFTFFIRNVLKGETIEVDDLPLKRQKGWQLVCVDGFPLGWGKLVNGSLRNKYLPGWRWQS